LLSVLFFLNGLVCFSNQEGIVNQLSARQFKLHDSTESWKIFLNSEQEVVLVELFQQ